MAICTASGDGKSCDGRQYQLLYSSMQGIGISLLYFLFNFYAYYIRNCSFILFMSAYINVSVSTIKKPKGLRKLTQLKSLNMKTVNVYWYLNTKYIKLK